MERGTSQDRGIYEGAKSSADVCYNLLKSWTSALNMASTASTTHDTTTEQMGKPVEGAYPNTEFDAQSFDFHPFEDGAFDSTQLPDSWLFTDWDVIGGV